MVKLLVPILAAVLLIAGCGGSDGDSPSSTAVPEATPTTAAAAAAPSATSAPAPSATPVPAPTEAPTEVPPPTEAPTEAPPPPPPPAPTTPPAPPAPQPTAPPPSGGAPVTLAVVATNLVFSRQSITVPANTQVTVNFTNNDTSVPHDFGVSLPGVAHTETCNGPCTRGITFNSGPPGTFTFQCSVHADMVGPFIVN